MPDSPLALGGMLVLLGGLAVIRAKSVAERWDSRLPIPGGFARVVIRLLGVAAVAVGVALVLQNL